MQRLFETGGGGDGDCGGWAGGGVSDCDCAGGGVGVADEASPSCNGIGGVLVGATCPSCAQKSRQHNHKNIITTKNIIL